MTNINRIKKRLNELVGKDFSGAFKLDLRYQQY